MHINNYLK